jgi:hypothetical protein
MTNSIEDLGGLNSHLSICLIIAWLIVFVALLKGIKSLGYFKFKFEIMNFKQF